MPIRIVGQKEREQRRDAYRMVGCEFHTNLTAESAYKIVGQLKLP